MVRVFSNQKTEHLIKKIELTQRQFRIQEKIKQKQQELLDNWKM